MAGLPNWTESALEYPFLEAGYLKTLMDREMAKVEPGLQIHDFFNKKEQDKEYHE